MRTDRSIGVFDSGLGGISVLRELVKLLPAEDYLYYGDSGNAPYGVRPTEEIRQLTMAAVEQMMGHGIKALVIACNTATTAAAKALREHYTDIPVVCIEPALKPAVAAGKGSTIVVMATEATLRERKFQDLLHCYQDEANIDALPCPGLPEFVERGEIYSDALRDFLSERFASLHEEHIDSIVLGCTHYPFVRKMIQEVAGPGVRIFDGAEGTARQLKRRLGELGQLKESAGKGQVTWMNSAKDEAKQIALSKKLFAL